MEAAAITEEEPVQEASSEPTSEEAFEPTSEDAGSEPLAAEPETPVPKQLRRRKAASTNKNAPIERPYIEMPEVNTNFWGQLLATQRAMEKTARSERLSNFVIT